MQGVGYRVQGVGCRVAGERCPAEGGGRRMLSCRTESPPLIPESLTLLNPKPVPLTPGPERCPAEGGGWCDDVVRATLQAHDLIPASIPEEYEFGVS